MSDDSLSGVGTDVEEEQSKSPSPTPSSCNDEDETDKNSQEETGEQQPPSLQEDSHLPNKTKPSTDAYTRKNSKFPLKLMVLLDSEENTDIIAWNSDGLSFVIKSEKVFTDTILRSHFKAGKFNSFVRKLYRWGFSRILRGANSGAFYHEDFQRGNYDRCKTIQGNHGKVAEKMPPTYDPHLNRQNSSMIQKPNGIQNVPNIVSGPFGFGQGSSSIHPSSLGMARLADMIQPNLNSFAAQSVRPPNISLAALGLTGQADNTQSYSSLLNASGLAGNYNNNLNLLPAMNQALTDNVRNIISPAMGDSTPSLMELLISRRVEQLEEERRLARERILLGEKLNLFLNNRG